MLHRHAAVHRIPTICPHAEPTADTEDNHPDLDESLQLLEHIGTLT